MVIYAFCAVSVWAAQHLTVNMCSSLNHCCCHSNGSASHIWLNYRFFLHSVPVPLATRLLFRNVPFNAKNTIVILRLTTISGLSVKLLHSRKRKMFCTILWFRFQLWAFICRWHIAMHLQCVFEMSFFAAAFGDVLIGHFRRDSLKLIRYFGGPHYTLSFSLR